MSAFIYHQSIFWHRWSITYYLSILSTYCSCIYCLSIYYQVSFITKSIYHLPVIYHLFIVHLLSSIYQSPIIISITNTPIIYYLSCSYLILCTCQYIYLPASLLYLHINLISISYLYTIYHLSLPINDLLPIFLISIFHISVCIMYLPIYYLSIYNLFIHLTYSYHLYILYHLSFTYASIFYHTVSFNPFSIHLSFIYSPITYLSSAYHI